MTEMEQSVRLKQIKNGDDKKLIIFKNSMCEQIDQNIKTGSLEDEIYEFSRLTFLIILH